MKRVNVSIIRLTVSLGLIAGCSAALMARVYLFTQAPIAARALEKTNRALSQLLPEFDNRPSEETIVLTGPAARPVTFYPARRGGVPVGFAAELITPNGFNGDVTVMAGLDCEGRITTVLVTRHAETPGLGSVVAERKRKKTILNLFDKTAADGLPPNPVLDQLAGRSAADPEAGWLVKKDGGQLDAVTGATITSRAVVGAVRQIAQSFSENQDNLLRGN